MAFNWLNKVTGLARHVQENLNLKVKCQRSDVKQVQTSQFRMMFCTAGQRTERFLTTVCEMLTNHVLSTFDPTQKVIDPDWLTGEKELGDKVEQMLQVSDDPQSLEEILCEMKEILELSMKNGHPRILNSATSGIDVMSLVGEWVTATANTNMFTYEIAPVFTLIEDIILTKMRSLVGWPDACGDGIFAPGAAISNMYALAVARHKLMPECKTKGMTQGSRLVVFVTSQSGSSVIRAAVLLGLGLKNVVFVDCNARGQMMASDLDIKIKMAIKDGGLPFFVSATSGSAMLGSFDPLIEIAEVCDGHGLWLHVDACHGGNALFSQSHAHLVRGVSRAHSVTWNCDMMMGVMLQCSAILIREKGLLEACNSACATYLFQQDKHYDVAYDTGDKAIQCGRHNDVFKLWLVWRARGDEGMARHVDRIFQLARYLTEKLLSTDGFYLVLPEFEFVTICFWYVPEEMRKLSEDKCDDIMKKLAKLTLSVVEKVNSQGNCMVSYFDPSKVKTGKQQQQSKMAAYKNQRQLSKERKFKASDLTLMSIYDLELPAFFKVIINNPNTEKADLDFVVEEIRKTGEEICGSILGCV